MLLDYIELQAKFYSSPTVNGDRLTFSKRGWKAGSMAGYWEADHIYQKAKGGSKTIENCLPACTPCNR